MPSFTPNNTSDAILMVVSGVRSSCETSDTNWRCTCDRSSSSASFSCRLAAISLNDLASAASSSMPRTSIRSLSAPAASFRAPWEASRTGITTQRVTSQAMAASKNTTATPTSNRVRCMLAMLCCSATRGKK